MNHWGLQDQHSATFFTKNRPYRFDPVITFGIRRGSKPPGTQGRCYLQCRFSYANLLDVHVGLRQIHRTEQLPTEDAIKDETGISAEQKLNMFYN